MRRIPLEQRRAELIDAAIRVIARDGLAAASTRAIVAEADMPLGAFHYAFSSRDELISAVISQVTDAERLAAGVRADLTHPGDTAPSIETVLSEGMEGYLTLLEDAPSGELALLEVALHMVRHDPEGVRAQWQTYRAAAEEALRHAAELAQVRWTSPVAELAASLARSLDGLTIAWLADRDSAAARVHIRFLARSFAVLTEADPTPPCTSETTEGHHADRAR